MVERTAASAAARWRPRDPGNGRWYVRLDADDHDVWLIGWPSGTGVPWHDHGGGAGAFTVIEGRLLECVAGPRGIECRDRTTTDDASVFDEQRIHAVVNVGPQLAISVHAYAPRLVSMTFFTEHDGAFAPSHVTAVAADSDLVH